jgi:dGTPase
MINVLVVDLCTQTAQNIEKISPKSIQDIRRTPYLAGFSEHMLAKNLALKQFLRKNLYQHYKVNRMSAKAQRIIRELFNVFLADIGLMPHEFQESAKADRARAVADYIAGMTDRFAIREHRRLFAVEDYF